MKKGTTTRKITIYRDAVTGRFVTEAYVEKNPDTTVTEKRKIIKPKKRGT
jgi:hypothetical protein